VSDKLLRDKIIGLLVKQLKEDYPACSRNNVLTDPIYSAFARSSLEQTIEETLWKRGAVYRELNALVAEIDANAKMTKEKA